MGYALHAQIIVKAHYRIKSRRSVTLASNYKAQPREVGA